MSLKRQKLVKLRGNRFYKGDCISGCLAHIPDNSIDLIITDPPYGIEGDQLHRHYYRDERYVVDGYIEVPRERYNQFSHQWIKQAERILKPNGQIYIISGYTNLYHILDALQATRLQEINHLIWKYNFGVFTKTKYVSSHYHILYYAKPGPGKRTFNLECRYGLQEKDSAGGSRNYQDREDVWIINREYKPGRFKNKNELPFQLLIKMIQYSSNRDELVCDLFMGGGSTAKVAIGLERRFVGFERSETVFEHGIRSIRQVKPGFLRDALPHPRKSRLANQGKKWQPDEIETLWQRYRQLQKELQLKKEIIAQLSREFGRGHWAIKRILGRQSE